jgi:excisionase family DNA binding protein
MVDRDEINERVETPKQLAKRVGITERQVRYLLQCGELDHVMIGSRIHIPDGAFRRFLASRMVKSCPDETRGPDYRGSRNGVAITSRGPSEAADASARLARQTANKLKSSSQNGCSTEDAERAQVIPLRSS